jgi:hypothetical protein
LFGEDVAAQFIAPTQRKAGGAPELVVFRSAFSRPLGSSTGENFFKN